MSLTVPCYVCGAVDYEKISGFYICRNCDTQSQDIQEQSFEYNNSVPFVANANVDEKEEIFYKVDAERPLTSWECYNLILKGLVDELIELGARPQLRKTAFQLWVLFLQTELIAFFSKTEEVLPTLPIRFKNNDIEILYGIKSFRQLYLKDLKKAARNYKIKKKPKKPEVKGDEGVVDVKQSETSTNITYRIHHKQREIAKSILENDSSQQEMKELPSDVEKFDSVRKKKLTSREVELLFRSSACEWMNDLMRRFARIMRKYDNDIEKIPRSVRLWFTKEIYCKRKSHSKPVIIPVTVNLMLVILRLALILIEDVIQWADLTRWACEGRLSCLHLKKFVPEKTFINPADVQPATRIHLIQAQMRDLTTILRIRDIPVPNMLVMIERYAYELCLPKEFVEFTKKLMAFFPPQMDYAYFDNRVFPDYESRVMAYILLTFKLLFSLDDVTEIKQSEFADNVNKYSEEMSDEEIAPLFSWTAWTRYIECRKAVLSKYDVTMNTLCESEVDTSSNAFLKHWENMQTDRNDEPLARRIPHHLWTQLEKTAQRKGKLFAEDDATINSVNFPPSMTPFRTYVQYLIDSHRELISKRCYPILSMDFSSHSIRHLLDSEWATTLGEKFNMDPIPVFKSSIEMKEFKKPIPNVPVLSKNRSIPGHVPTPVRVLNDRARDKLEKTSEEFHPTFRSFDLNSNAETTCGSGTKLYYPSANYWMFHKKLTRSHYQPFLECARSNLSVSFAWLLKECSRIIRCEAQDLYDELSIVEYAYTCLFSNDNEYDREAPFNILANEW